MSKVVVEFDYLAKEPDELTLSKGDIINDVVKKQGGWWEGVLKDKKGMFPDNFVRLLDNESSIVLRNQKDVSRIRQCRVIFSYNQDHEDELNLKVGDIIDIVGEEEEGWWRGQLNGKEGVFPSNFVKELTWQPSPSIRVTNTLENGNDGKPPKLPAKPNKHLCEATYPYKAQNEDELSFQEGDIITILNKDSQDPGWWHGELNGKTGVFPDNFVVLISDNRISKENRKSTTDKGAIKSVSVASQRKSLEQKKELVENVSHEISKPVPISQKPIISVKKSPSNSGLGFLSEIRKKIEDAVDGTIGSKHSSVIEDVSKNKDNSFDHVERRPLLTDVRANRVKAPGRRPPTTLHKDDVPPASDDTTNSCEANVNSNVKPRLREWEKHKAPWLEEMKKNQVKRTLITNSEEEQPYANEGKLKLDTAKTPPESKICNDVEKNEKPNHDSLRHSIINSVKDIPENANRDSLKEPIIKSPRGEAKRENMANILERLERLENIVEKQNKIIEELQNKLRIEVDYRMLLQEKIVNLQTQ